MYNILDVAFYRETWSNRFNRHDDSINGDDNNDNNNNNNNEGNIVIMLVMIMTVKLVLWKTWCSCIMQIVSEPIQHL